MEDDACLQSWPRWQGTGQPKAIVSLGSRILIAFLTRGITLGFDFWDCPRQGSRGWEMEALGRGRLCPVISLVLERRSRGNVSLDDSQRGPSVSGSLSWSLLFSPVSKHREGNQSGRSLLGDCSQLFLQPGPSGGQATSNVVPRPSAAGSLQVGAEIWSARGRQGRWKEPVILLS